MGWNGWRPSRGFRNMGTDLCAPVLSAGERQTHSQGLAGKRWGEFRPWSHWLRDWGFFHGEILSQGCQEAGRWGQGLFFITGSHSQFCRFIIPPRWYANFFF